MNPQFLDAIEATIKLCTALTLIMSIANIIATIVSRVKAPEVRQDERIAELEARVGKVEDRQAESEARLRDSESAMKIVMQSLLALMRHSIDGNHVDSLKEAARNLDEYLVQK